ncbi:MAG: futalosine hydrolase [Desulfovibrio sp.]|jgi:futalosine hydrolase|nr:futalosine hydrolase [Desulfovibrio sp.]
MESTGAAQRGALLLVCAAASELRATLALLPGGNDIALPDEARPPFALPRDEAQHRAGSAAPRDEKQRRDSACSPESPERVLLETALPVLKLTRCDLYLLICGVGPVAAALSLGACLGGFMRIARREMPDGVINTGLAGSYDLGKAPVGSLLAVDEERLAEYGVREETGVLSALELPQLVTDSGPVYSRLALDPDAALARMAPALGKTPASRHTVLESCARGAALTVAGISGNPALAARTAQLCGGLAETMEGFALALACAAARVPFAEFRAVSNAAGYRPPHTWNTPDALAALGWLGAELFCRA